MCNLCSRSSISIFAKPPPVLYRVHRVAAVFTSSNIRQNIKRKNVNHMLHTKVNVAKSANMQLAQKNRENGRICRGKILGFLFFWMSFEDVRRRWKKMQKILWCRFSQRTHTRTWYNDRMVLTLFCCCSALFTLFFNFFAFYCDYYFISSFHFSITTTGCRWLFSLYVFFSYVCFIHNYKWKFASFQFSTK